MNRLWTPNDLAVAPILSINASNFDASGSGGYAVIGGSASVVEDKISFTDSARISLDSSLVVKHVITATGTVSSPDWICALWGSELNRAYAGANKEDYSFVNTTNDSSSYLLSVDGSNGKSGYASINGQYGSGTNISLPPNTLSGRQSGVNVISTSWDESKNLKFLRYFTNGTNYTQNAGDVYCWMAFDSVLSTDDLQKLEGWILHTYGDPSFLEAGHPYRDNPAYVEIPGPYNILSGGNFAGPKNVTLNGGSFVRESSVRVLNNQGGSFGPTPPLAEDIADPFPGTIFSDGTLFDNGTFEYKAGTLNHATSSAVMDDLIKNPSREKEIYLTQDHENATYIRNPNRILPQANLTGVSPWNSDLGNRKAGNAITPRHLHFATHYAIALNATVRFVTLDDEVIERTLVSRQNVAGDLSIGTLDSDLPESILPSKVLPENWTEYFTESSAQYMALFVTDQEEKLLLKRPDQGSITVRDPVLSAYLSFNETLVGGDSGSPAFLIVDNQPVAYTQMHTATTGTPLHQNLAAIEAIVSQTGHQLQYLDLTRYENHAS